MATKDQIRAERGFKKEADKCSNCAFRRWELTNYICEKDNFNVTAMSWCHLHQRKQG